MHQIRGEHVGCGPVEAVLRGEPEVIGKDFEHIPAFFDVVGQKLDSVGAHQAQQCVLVPVEVRVRAPEFQLHGGKFAPQDGHEKVAAAAGRLQEPRINALGSMRSVSPFTRLSIASTIQGGVRTSP